jgi:hypothetical protein
MHCDAPLGRNSCESRNRFSFDLADAGKCENRFIAIGALAAIAQGVIATTEDVDVVYSRRAENLKRIVEALAPFHLICEERLLVCPFSWTNVSCATA